MGAIEEHLHDGEEILAKVRLPDIRLEYYATNERLLRWGPKILRGNELSELSYSKITSVIQNLYHHKFYIGVGVFLILLGVVGPILGLRPTFGANAFVVSFAIGIVIAGSGATILKIASYELNVSGVDRRDAGKWKFEIVGYPLTKKDKVSADKFSAVVAGQISGRAG
jgi:hypothetical protein